MGYSGNLSGNSGQPNRATIRPLAAAIGVKPRLAEEFAVGYETSETGPSQDHFATGRPAATSSAEWGHDDIVAVAHRK
jgi:hypothetical protein